MPENTKLSFDLNLNRFSGGEENRVDIQRKVILQEKYTIHFSNANIHYDTTLC